VKSVRGTHHWLLVLGSAIQIMNRKTCSDAIEHLRTWFVEIRRSQSALYHRIHRTILRCLIQRGQLVKHRSDQRGSASEINELIYNSQNIKLSSTMSVRYATNGLQFQMKVYNGRGCHFFFAGDHLQGFSLRGRAWLTIQCACSLSCYFHGRKLSANSKIIAIKTRDPVDDEYQRTFLGQLLAGSLITLVVACAFPACSVTDRVVLFLRWNGRLVHEATTGIAGTKTMPEDGWVQARYVANDRTRIDSEHLSTGTILEKPVISSPAA